MSHTLPLVAAGLARRCVVWVSKELKPADLDVLATLKDVQVTQLTPGAWMHGVDVHALHGDVVCGWCAA